MFKFLDFEKIKSVHHSESSIKSLLLMLRFGTLAIIVTLLAMHLRSVRVFRWEQSVSGGLLTTYLLAVVGLALCAGTHSIVGQAFVLQCYLCSTGALLLIVNAVTLWLRWRSAGALTRAVADLLSALGVVLRRQVMIKVALNTAAACGLIIDLILVVTAVTTDLQVPDMKESRK